MEKVNVSGRKKNASFAENSFPSIFMLGPNAGMPMCFMGKEIMLQTTGNLGCIYLERLSHKWQWCPKGRRSGYTVNKYIQRMGMRMRKLCQGERKPHSSTLYTEYVYQNYQYYKWKNHSTE